MALHRSLLPPPFSLKPPERGRGGLPAISREKKRGEAYVIPEEDDHNPHAFIRYFEDDDQNPDVF